MRRQRPASTPSDPFIDRRYFLRSAATATGALAVVAAQSSWLRGEVPATPKQTAGPYYPVPAIDAQRYSDTDLTRLLEDGPLAEGDLVIVSGTVRGIDEQPLSGAVVEIWQACVHGTYNHERDERDTPRDPHFQYWGRMEVADDGHYAFRTIRPGKYPGRTPHIHYRVIAPGHRELITQLYFDDLGEWNAKDGIYNEMSREEQGLVTVAFAPNDEKTPLGHFDVAMVAN
jgi:protocatechuate 3,4-dioxygenase, beta subunit